MPKSIHKKRKEESAEDINLILHELLSKSHEYLNEVLFAVQKTKDPGNINKLVSQRLSKPILTWCHEKRQAGAFWSIKREDQESLGCWNINGTNAFEITMNPHYVLKDPTGKYFFQVLTHEMVHQWQAQFGTPGKTYHNSQFADKMESLGLICSHTGQEGGRRTGRSMSEYIVPGKFLDAFEERPDILKTLFKKVSHIIGFASAPKKNKKNKIKYKCNGEDCDLTVWGKPGLSEGGKLYCYECDQPLDEA